MKNLNCIIVYSDILNKHPVKRVCSTVGVCSAVQGVQYRGGYHEYHGGYLECHGGYSVL